MALIDCPDCKKKVSSLAVTCLNCGRPIKDGNNLVKKEHKYYSWDDGLPKKTMIQCSNCKSSKVEKISGVSKGVSAIAFGILAIGKITKTYQCKSCGYRW